MSIRFILFVTNIFNYSKPLFLASFHAFENNSISAFDVHVAPDTPSSSSFCFVFICEISPGFVLFRLLPYCNKICFVSSDNVTLSKPQKRLSLNITSAVSVYSSKSFDSSGYTVTVSLYVPGFNGTRLGSGVGSTPGLAKEPVSASDKQYFQANLFHQVLMSVLHSGFGFGVFFTPRFFRRFL